MRSAVRRAVGLLVVAVVLAVVCSLLGRWQWNRHVWRDGQIAIVEANWSAAAVPLDTVLDGPGATITGDDEWRQVIATGHYDADATVLLRNRPVDGNPAYHVLVPFVVDDASAGTSASPTQAGTVLVVDRGWVPLGANGSDDVAAPAPPSGTVTLTARLRLDEKPSTRPAPDGQVHAISTEQVLAAGGLDGSDTYATYGQMVDEDPAAAVALGTLEPPSTDPGSHLSYAFQWWTFALGGLVAFSVAARRELRSDAPAASASAPGGSGAPPPPRQPGPRVDRPHRRGGRDEDDEDALIDAQLSPDRPR
ncbi:SURF1 family protein [Cellulomonas sp.]|uniref:SURF1 family cytochrome oxidase biogenesis protein n=1 Tax=Cellulomonas sp. TaxID=40001 RepID=UPI001B03E487|nr:SURF1 family protein [Cellulomonas sp.]MBO9556125.1 SURF1 family protein [Cellulomonas sp.]